MKARMLEEIGLTKNEVAVYFALLEQGSSTVTPLVSKTQVTPSKIYAILDRLIAKGLVSYVIKSNKKYFAATSPTRIIDYLDEKENDIAQKKKQIEKILPSLLLKEQLNKEQSQATIYKGLKGVKTAFSVAQRSLQPKQEILATGISFTNKNLSNFLKHYFTDCSTIGHHLRSIHSSVDYDNVMKQLGNKISAQTRFVTETFPAATFVFNKTVLLFPETEELLLIAIESEEVASSFKTQFELTWNQEVLVSKELEGAYAAWDLMLDELKSGESYYVLGASWLGKKDDAPAFYLDFHKRRQKKGVKAKFLFIAGTKPSLQKYADAYYNLTEIRFLPQNVYSGMQINLYKNKVLMFVQRDKGPIMLSIDDKTVYKTFKTYFDALWEGAHS